MPHSTRSTSLPLLMLLLLGGACDADSMGADGGRLDNDASPEADAGPRGDAGSPRDAGSADASVPDGGATDAGGVDAGPPAVTECNDGIDNDGDGFVDWQTDIGCYGASDRTEAAGPREDEDGWTTFDVGSDDHVYFVSTDGDDANDGLSPESPFRTVNHAADLVRDGSHDVILLRRGDTFRGGASSGGELRLGRFKSGRSAEEPIVIASYGASEERPRLEIGHQFIDHNGRARSNVALVGLMFIRYDSTPGDPEFTGNGSVGLRYVGGGSGLLIEGCHFKYAEIVVQSCCDGGGYAGVDIRRNVIERAYHANTCIPGNPNGNREFRPSGIFGSGIDRFLLEENFFDHNGWNLDEVDSACATIYNHNVYLPNLTNSVIRGNVFSRASSIHIKATAGAGGYDTVVIEDNFMVGGEIGMSIGGNTEGDSRFNNITIRRNVLNQVGRGRPTTRGLSWGIDIIDNNTTLLEDNYLLNFDEGNSWGLRFGGGTNHDVTARNNLLYSVNSNGIRVDRDTGHTGMRLESNRIIHPDGAPCFVRHAGGFGEYTYRNNEYFAADGRFCVPGREDFSAWTAMSGETGGSLASSAPMFVDSARTIDTYAEHIGIAGTAETAWQDFIDASIQQSRLSWRWDLMAYAINDYMRAGYTEE